jgi:hypothetical protein
VAVKHPRCPAAGERLFEIVETVVYQVPGRDPAGAIARLLSDPGRDAHFFEAVRERQVHALGVAEI